VLPSPARGTECPATGVRGGGLGQVLGAAARFLGESDSSVYVEQGDDEVGESGPDLRLVSGADE
jgi:hypothetical protein